MNFADLYRISNSATSPHTAFRFLAETVKAHHPRVGDVETWKCELDENVSFAHMTYEPDRSSAYAESYDVAVIRFAGTLNRCWRRAACTKELMHVFDDSAAQASDGGRFLILLKQLEAKSLLPGDATAMFHSELNAEWMAVLTLCPQRLRAQFEPEYNKTIDDMYIANKLKIPKIMVPALMGDYYWRALERLTGEPIPSDVKKGHPAAI